MKAWPAIWPLTYIVYHGVRHTSSSKVGFTAHTRRKKIPLHLSKESIDIGTEKLEHVKKKIGNATTGIEHRTMRKSRNGAEQSTSRRLQEPAHNQRPWVRYPVVLPKFFRLLRPQISASFRRVKVESSFPSVTVGKSWHR